MNIQLPSSWIRDFIETKATAQQMAEALSLHSFSVEKITDTADKDHVFEIEVTPNRFDALSVLGVARELQVVLPRMGYPSVWKTRDQNKAQFTKNQSKLDIVVKDQKLVPAYAGMIIEDIKLQASPAFIQTRLEKAGIRSINNLVDITNYVMLELGQPMHAFDYDKISQKKMTFRASKKGESLTTLDHQKMDLPKGAIVVEDGAGQLIDLCGIMGAENSAISASTKSVFFLAPVYDKVSIRKVSMFLGNRSEAALRFEKGLDQGNLHSAITLAVQLLNQTNPQARSSEIISSTQQVYTPVKVRIDAKRISQIAGMEFHQKTIEDILLALGFAIEGKNALVPSWRAGDVEITEDLAEEVIRIHGYAKIVGELPPQNGISPHESGFYRAEDKIKDILKYQGFYECYTNSATSEDKVDSSVALPLLNPLSENFHTLRTSLVPQLLAVLDENKGFKEDIRLFEIASVFHKNGNELPLQPRMLSLVSNSLTYLELKGIIQALFTELHIRQPESIDIKEHQNGALSVEINVDQMVRMPVVHQQYQPISLFNSIKEDLTLTVEKDQKFSDIVDVIANTSAQVVSIKYKDLYQNALTLSLEYLDTDKQINSADVLRLREKYLSKLSTLGVRLKD